MLHICITFIHIFLVYCLVNQTISLLLVVQLIVMIFHSCHPSRFDLHDFLDQIRQNDMFCNVFIFLCIQWSLAHSCQRVRNNRGPLYFMEHAHVLPTSIFQFCPINPFPVASNLQPHCAFCCLVPLPECVIAPHLMYCCT